MPLQQRIINGNRKGLFDVAIGEGNISEEFALELQNARVAINGEVSKRRGRSRFNTTAFPSDKDIKTVAVFQNDAFSGYEVLAYGGTELRRYNSATDSFDTLIKSGLTDDTRLYKSVFNGRLVFSNGVDAPFKYGYVPTPIAPTLGTSTAGAKAARTYYVTVTYISANGETIASEESSQLVPLNDVLTVTSPVAFNGATGWNVYYSTTSGAPLLQNASPLTIGVNHTETTGGLNNGAAPPSTSDAWFVADLSDNPDKFRFMVALNSRLWGAGILDSKLRFVGCAVGNEDDWTTVSDSVDIDLSAVLNVSDEITGLSRLSQGGKLIIALKNHIITYAVPQVHGDISIDKQVFNTGAISHRGMAEVGVDNFIVESQGVNSLKNEIIVQGLTTKKLSDNIKDRIVPELVALADGQEVSVVNYKSDNEYIINIPSLSKRYIYNCQMKTWAEDTGIIAYDSVLAPDGKLLSGTEDGFVAVEYQNLASVDVYGDGNGDVNVAFQWDTPWLWLNSVAIKKLFRYFQFKGSGTSSFTLSVYFDFESSVYKSYLIQPQPSHWDQATWDASLWDYPDINKTLIPLLGRGKAVKFSFTANSTAELSISFYGVQFKPAGFRGSD